VQVNDRFEFVQPPVKRGEWWLAQLAVNGQLACPVEVPAETRAHFLTEAEFVAYLVRQSRSLIDQYGDYRTQRQFV